MPSSRSNGRTKHHGFHMRLKEVSDLELLEAINDQSNEDGYASSRAIGMAFGVSEEYAARVCAARFGWMKRWGWLDYKPGSGELRGDGLYKVTRLGNSLIDGIVPPEFERMVKAMSDADRIRLTRILSRAAGGRRQGVRTAYRREWTRNTQLTVR